MIWSAARPVTSAMRSNCRVKLPAPAVADRNSTINSPISASGIMARTRSQPDQPSRVSNPRICPRRPDRMALILAVASVGQTISTTWIGSSSTGWHCGSASLTPIRAARPRRDRQHHIAELAVTAGLFLVPAALGDRFADGLLVADRRRMRLDVDAKALAQPLQRDPQ